MSQIVIQTLCWNDDPIKDTSR